MDNRHFVGRTKTLIAKFRNQFYSGDILRRIFRKFGRKYQEKLQKSVISTARITESGCLDHNARIVTEPLNKVVQIGY